MSKIFWKSLLVSPVLLSGLIVSANVNAQETTNNSDVINQLNNYSREGVGQNNNINQVTSVSQLRDVSPGDWAFEALRNLVERYGCIAGYPDRTFRGNQALTRYEFAAGLNACMQQIERLIVGGDRGLDEGELETLKRLTDEFQAELAALGARVDNLEARVGELEDNQFSTTTKLQGEVVFAITDTFGDDPFGGSDDTQTVFGNRVRLALNTSFTGKDTLITRLAAGNLGAFDSPTTTQTFNLGNTGNDVIIDWVAYYLPIGNSQLYVVAAGGIHSDYAPTNNPYFEDYDGGNGALSTFASENPIYRIGGGVGAAFTLGFGKEGSFLGKSGATIGYLAGPDASDPSSGNGIFNGEYAALGQVNFNIKDRIGLGLTYVHAYHKDGSDIFDLGGGTGTGMVGTRLANNPSAIYGGGLDMVTNSYGVEASVKLGDRFSISGYGSYTNVLSLGSGQDSGDDIWTYGLGFAVTDLLKEGSVLGIFGGVQPYLATDTFSQQNPIHVEAFYKYKLSDNISITPGVIWLSNPGGFSDGNDDNIDTFIGTLRTTFTF